MRRWFSADYHLLFRLIKAVLFLGCVGILVSMFAFFSFTISDLFICLMAFLPTGWAILQVTFLSHECLCFLLV
jgi:callose synthase